MIKPKIRERRIFTSRKHRNRRNSGLVAITSVVLVLLVLELLTRIFVDLSGTRSQYAQASSQSDLNLAYQLQFAQAQITPDQIAKSNTLMAQPSLSVGYQLFNNQESPYYQINSQGFRDSEPVSLLKPQEEIRIFLLGGSTAFGYEIDGNQNTIGEFLEQRLQQRLQQQQTSPNLYQPDLLPSDPTEKQKHLAKHPRIKTGKYRTINASVPGYASGNELAQVALEILKYKPDLIVILDGYEDLMLPSDRQGIQAPAIESTQSERISSFTDYLGKMVEKVENKSYLAKIAQKRWLNSSPPPKQRFAFNESTPQLVNHLPSSPEELERRIQRYLEHHQQILSLSAAAKVPLIVALQPEITGRNPSQLTDVEGKITTELGRTYIKQMRDNYPVLINQIQKLANAYPQNLKVLDLYKLTDKYPSPSFVDPIHLNEAANQKVAEQLYYAIASFPKMQLVPKQAPTTVSNEQ